jgi:hypothetical protein
VRPNTNARRTKDNTVPYPSALIETTDPFANWEDRGVEVETDENGIIQSWRLGTGDGLSDQGDSAQGSGSITTSDDTKAGKTQGASSVKGRKKKGNWASRMVGNLPPVLRYRFPFNYVSV